MILMQTNLHLYQNRGLHVCIFFFPALQKLSLDFHVNFHIAFFSVGFLAI